MVAVNKLTAIHDGVGATLTISGLTESYMITNISGGGFTVDMTELENIDAVAWTQRLNAVLRTMKPLSVTCINQGTSHRSAISASIGIKTIVLTSPKAYNGTDDYALTFTGVITDAGDHEFSKGSKSEFTIEVTPTGVKADGTEDAPTYS